MEHRFFITVSTCIPKKKNKHSRKTMRIENQIAERWTFRHYFKIKKTKIMTTQQCKSVDCVLK